MSNMSAVVAVTGFNPHSREGVATLQWSLMRAMRVSIRTPVKEWRSVRSGTDPDGKFQSALP